MDDFIFIFPFGVVFISSHPFYPRRGRKDGKTFKALFLNTALDPPNWNRTLDMAQEAKDLEIGIAAMARGEDEVSEENFRKLSSGALTWFGEEKAHINSIYRSTDGSWICDILKVKPKVCTELYGLSQCKDV